jgi:hypothetical protein
MNAGLLSSVSFSACFFAMRAFKLKLLQWLQFINAPPHGLASRAGRQKQPANICTQYHKATPRLFCSRLAYVDRALSLKFRCAAKENAAPCIASSSKRTH